MSETTGLRPIPSFAEACDRGKVREENQDSVRHSSTHMGELVIVADGIGGYRGGGTASRIVVESISSWVSAQASNYSPARAIAEAAALANTNIREAAASGEAAYRQMGSTVVLALITPDEYGAQAWIGHIGDSRAYLSRAGHLSHLTKDHSAVQALIDRNEISAADARSHPQASVLTRSLGHQPEVEIEISMIQLEAGDSLLLCTDGLWGFVPEPAIANVMTNPEFEAGDAAAQLLDLALDAGGHDNIGIEVVHYGHPAAEEEQAPLAGVNKDDGKNQGEEKIEPNRGRKRAIMLGLLLAVSVGALAVWYAEQKKWIPPISLSR